MDTPFTLTRDEVRELDRRAIEGFGVPGIVLMENAGRGCAELLMRLNPEKKPVVILCGPGNNGGDGFVIARHLDNHGWPVKVWLILSEAGNRRFGFGQAVAAIDLRLSPDCNANYSIWTHSHSVADNRKPGEEWKQAVIADVNDSAFVVDALFGTGLTRPLEQPFDALIPFLNRSGKSILAID